MEVSPNSNELYPDILRLIFSQSPQLLVKSQQLSKNTKSTTQRPYYEQLCQTNIDILDIQKFYSKTVSDFILGKRSVAALGYGSLYDTSELIEMGDNEIDLQNSYTVVELDDRKPLSEIGSGYSFSIYRFNQESESGPHLRYYIEHHYENRGIFFQNVNKFLSTSGLFNETKVNQIALSNLFDIYSSRLSCVRIDREYAFKITYYYLLNEKQRYDQNSNNPFFIFAFNGYLRSNFIVFGFKFQLSRIVTNKNPDEFIDIDPNTEDYIITPLVANTLNLYRQENAQLYQTLIDSFLEKLTI